MATELTMSSRLVLYVLLGLMGFFALIILVWQIQVMRGRRMENPDGSADDWHDQPLFYGIAVADVFLACPATIAGAILAAFGSRWGFYVTALSASWFVWANTMTTAHSLKFERPKITLSWIVAYPLEILLGAGYIASTVVSSDLIFGA